MVLQNVFIRFLVRSCKFNKLLSLRNHVIILCRSPGFLINIKFCNAGKGSIYASVDPVVSACPDRCGVRTFCGPKIEIPTKILSDCMEQYYENQVLRMEPYDSDPDEQPQPLDADFVLFVNAAENPLSKAVVSENAFCQLDLVTYRPIAGYLTFNLQKLAEFSNQDYDSLLAQVKHSLCHILGFSLNILALSPALNRFSYEG